MVEEDGQIELVLMCREGDRYQYSGNGRTDRSVVADVPGCYRLMSGVDREKDSYHTWDVKGSVEVVAVEEGRIDSYNINIERHREEWQNREEDQVHSFGEGLEGLQVHFEKGEAEVGEEINKKELDVLTYRLSQGNILFRKYEDLFTPHTVSEGEMITGSSMEDQWKDQLEITFSRQLKEDNEIDSIEQTGGDIKYYVEEIDGDRTKLEHTGTVTFQVVGGGEEGEFQLDWEVELEALLVIDHEEHRLLEEDVQKSQVGLWGTGEEESEAVVRIEQELDESYEFSY